MKIEPTDQCRIKSEKYQTRKGDPVRIYATDAGGMYPVHGARQDGGLWTYETWTKDGKHISSDEESFRDLVEIPQTVTFWVNVYHGMFGSYNETRREADFHAAPERIGVLRIEITGDNYEVFKEEI
jgi:hypothetical protein